MREINEQLLKTSGADVLSFRRKKNVKNPQELRLTCPKVKFIPDHFQTMLDEKTDLLKFAS